MCGNSETLGIYVLVGLMAREPCGHSFALIHPPIDNIECVREDIKLCSRVHLKN